MDSFPFQRYNMNSDKKQHNEEVELLSNNDKDEKEKKKKTDPKKISRTVLTVAEVVFVSIVYVLVWYFLAAAQTAFLSRDSTMDKICVAILACFVTIILPAMLYFYLKTRIRSRFFSPLLYIVLLHLVLKGIIIYVGVPNMSYEFIYGKLFQ